MKGLMVFFLAMFFVALGVDSADSIPFLGGDNESVEAVGSAVEELGEINAEAHAKLSNSVQGLSDSVGFVENLAILIIVILIILLFLAFGFKVQSNKKSNSD